MNRIIFPLTINMQKAMVANLHATLRFLNFDVAEDEIQENTYGETTTTAVSQFQMDHRLRKTGSVDEETAHLLNQRLHEAGYLEQHDSYSIQGRISDQTQNPVPGLLVRTVDMDPSAENPLGGPVITNEGSVFSQ